MLPAASLPIPPSLHVETLLLGADGLTILASSETAAALCPPCGQRSRAAAPASRGARPSAIRATVGGGAHT